MLAVANATLQSSRAATNLPTVPLAQVADPIDLDELRAYVPVVQRKLTAGQYLYRSGQPFHALFLVQSGFLKTGMIAEDGREQVTGFRMRGDLLGVESIGLATHAGDAVALDSSHVWELAYPAMLKACAHIPALQAQLTEAMAAEIRSDRSWMLALGTLGAEKRVACFLLNSAARHAAQGFSAKHFVLRMRRADIGSFLALTHETVTRALSRLSAQGCIAVDWREVRILDADALRETLRKDARVH